ncbi:sodium/sugar symporter [Opitutales bacterium ASA1]|uniref:SLC5 family protein n=1 Tax=Congregicoccus parvus TaxID=3081749 RepID=UPI002B307A7D|nr:sodium/sugar symporter [Opitutales bacterium ASA1]
MTFTTVDYVVFFGFYASVVAFALWKSRGERTSADYFLGGRSLPWWLIGISIVAANISTEQMVGMAGQGAGGTGLAVSLWQLTGTVGVVLIAFTLLPRLLRSGIYTIPEFLEYRYNTAARSIMAIATVLIYVAVLVTAVLYSGGLVIHTVFGLQLTTGIWILAVVAALYTTWGGLKAVAWADLFQGLTLLAGGMLVFFLGLHAVGGWESFTTVNAEKLHMILPADHPDLPWTGVVSGMWIVILYYCGLNQFIVQRNLAARTLRDGQLGVIFAGALWLLVPFAIVMPGIMAGQLFGEQLAKPDQAYPMMIRELVPAGLRGFMLAAIAGAIVSTLASMINSASTVFTMDVYHRLLDRRASQMRLVVVGRIVTVVAVVVGALLAPRLADPAFGGVFAFIQNFQGYIWPGVVAAFVVGLLVPQAPGSAGVAALVGGPAIYHLFQVFAPQKHFLVQVALTFNLVVAVMGLITFIRPLVEPRVLPVREDLDVRTSPIVRIVGGAVIAATVVLVYVFR